MHKSILHIKTRLKYSRGRTKESIDRQHSWERFQKNVIAPRLKWKKMTEEERIKYGVKDLEND